MKILLALVMLLSSTVHANEWTVERAEGEIFAEGTYSVILEFDGNTLLLESDTQPLEGSEIFVNDFPMTNFSANSSPVVAVTGRQMFGLLNRIENIVSSASSRQKASNALNKLYEEESEVLQELDAIRAVLRAR